MKIVMANAVWFAFLHDPSILGKQTFHES